MTDLQLTLYLLLFPPALVGFFALILNLLSAVGGWRALARSYPATSPAEGRRFSFRSARLDPVAYGGVLDFVAGRKGLSISLCLPFHPAHPPLFVPWTDISAKHRGFWPFRYVDLRFAKQPRVRMLIGRRLAEELAAVGGNALKLATPGGPRNRESGPSRTIGG